MMQRRHRILAQNIQNLLNFRPGDVFFEDSGKTDDRKCTHAQSENTFGCCFKYLTYIYIYIYLYWVCVKFIESPQNEWFQTF